MSPYRPSTSAKMRMRIIPTKRRGCWAVPRTPASPTIPIAKPAARPDRPTDRPAPRWAKLLHTGTQHSYRHAAWPYRHATWPYRHAAWPYRHATWPYRHAAWPYRHATQLQGRHKHCYSHTATGTHSATDTQRCHTGTHTATCNNTARQCTFVSRHES